MSLTPPSVERRFFAGQSVLLICTQSHRSETKLTNSMFDGRLGGGLAQAVNLSQGFPNEAPPVEMSLAAAGAMLDGKWLAPRTIHLFMHNQYEYASNRFCVLPNVRCSISVTKLCLWLPCIPRISSRIHWL